MCIGWQTDDSMRKFEITKQLRNIFKSSCFHISTSTGFQGHPSGVLTDCLQVKQLSKDLNKMTLS